MAMNHTCIHNSAITSNRMSRSIVLPCISTVNPVNRLKLTGQVILQQVLLEWRDQTGEADGGRNAEGGWEIEITQIIQKLGCRKILVTGFFVVNNAKLHQILILEQKT